MQYLRINNLFNSFNQPDYKGLDIDLFISGSQVYDLEPSSNYCIIATNEENIISHSDIQIISESEYLQEKQNIIAKQKVTDPIQQLKQQVDEQAIALAALIGGAV